MNSAPTTATTAMRQDLVQMLQQEAAYAEGRYDDEQPDFVDAEEQSLVSEVTISGFTNASLYQGPMYPSQGAADLDISVHDANQIFASRRQSNTRPQCPVVVPEERTLTTDGSSIKRQLAYHSAALASKISVHARKAVDIKTKDKGVREYNKKDTKLPTCLKDEDTSASRDLAKRKYSSVNEMHQVGKQSVPGAFAGMQESEKSFQEDENDAAKLIMDCIDSSRIILDIEGQQDTAGTSSRGVNAPASYSDTPRPASLRRSMDRFQVESSQPGAYLGLPGENLQRRSDINFSVVRVHPENNEAQILFHDQTALGSGLAEATPVSEDSLPSMEAQPVDRTDRRSDGTKQDQCKLSLLLLFVLVVAITALVTVIGFIADSSNNDVSATSVPSFSPSESPSSSPTGALDQMVDNLPGYTLASLQNFSSPQSKALDWLSNHPDLPDFPEWRKRQLFALVTFYYAMDGDSWQQAIKDRWLQYDEHECFWFSGRYGYINEDGEYVEDQSFGVLGQDAPCNNKFEFQLLILFDLAPSTKRQTIPREIELLPSLSSIALPYNSINASFSDFVPAEAYDLKLDYFGLHGNKLKGSLPSDLGKLTNLERLELILNALSGPLPSELGKLTQMVQLALRYNSFSGSLPTELGALTKMTAMGLDHTGFSGPIPSQLGLLTSSTYLALYDNSLTGKIPSELGMLSGLETLSMAENALSGPIPSELGLLTEARSLVLDINALTGTVPVELESLALNGSLNLLSLDNNTLSGTIPEGLCSLGRIDWNAFLGLSFDCSDKLCGCCWCPCPGSNYTSECQSDPFVPSRDVEEWPGEFPTPANSSNTIMINVRTDRVYLDELKLEWTVLRDAETDWWEVVDYLEPQDPETLLSYPQEVESAALYRLQIFDFFGDGTCCTVGFGWFTITESSPSDGDYRGSVVWEAGGHEFETSMEVFIWVDEGGQAQQVQYLPGEGYGYLLESGNSTIVVAAQNKSGIDDHIDLPLTMLP